MEAVMYGSIPASVQEAIPELVRMLAARGASESAQSALSALVEHGVLAHESAPVELGPNAAYVTTELYRQWQEQIETLLPQYQLGAEYHLPKLTLLLEDHCSPVPVGLRWTIVAGWLLDIRLNGVLREFGWQGREPSRFWVWVFEKADPNLTGFGVRTQSDPDTDTYFGEVWVAGVHKVPALPLNLRPQDIRTAWHLHTGQAERPSPAELMRARYFGLVQRRGSDDELLVPCFGTEELVPLLQAVDESAREIVNRTLLAADFSPAMPGDAGEKRPIYMHAFARLFMQTGLRVLLESKWLERPESHVPSAWGTWIARGESARQFFHPPYLHQDGQGVKP